MAVAVLVAASVAGAVAVFAAAADNSPTNQHLEARVVATNTGPLQPCSADCTSANIVRQFIYIANHNQLTNEGSLTRAAEANAFVVSRIDVAVFVDGVDTVDYFETPPPNTNYAPYSGHWPATVTCPPAGPPCNVVSSPAILPGEDTAIFYWGWAHGDTEPNGVYVFSYTIPRDAQRDARRAQCKVAGNFDARLATPC